MNRRGRILTQILLCMLLFPTFESRSFAESSGVTEGDDYVISMSEEGSESHKPVHAQRAPHPPAYKTKTERACIGVPADIRSAVTPCQVADECAKQGKLATTEQKVIPNSQTATSYRGTDRVIDSRTYCDEPDGANVDELARVEFYRYKPQVPAPMYQPDTLIVCNVPEVFSSSVGPVDLPVTLVGRSVVLRVTPTLYHWVWGDGEYKNTTHPGAPVVLEEYETWDEVERAADVSHRFMTKGVVEPYLNVTFKGEYSVDGGPFKPIRGTIEADSPTVRLEVVEFRAELVSPERS